MTPAQRVIRSRNDEIVRRWNRARFKRLAMALELTEPELGEMAYVQSTALRGYLKKNMFPPPVAGHLENIERWMLMSKLGIKFKKGTAQDIVLKKKMKESGHD